MPKILQTLKSTGFLEKVSLFNQQTFEILGLSELELSSLFKEAGEASFRGKQLFDFLHKKRIFDSEKWHNMPKKVRNSLNQFKIPLETLKNEKASDGTNKFLFQTEKGEEIESVWLPFNQGKVTLCLSSQVGCALGCTFCATGLMGFKRNLSAAEIVAQVYKVEEIMENPISGIVFMGMGEPLANLDNVIKAIEILKSPQGKNMGSRRITVSSSGLCPEILELGERIDVNLAISINATTEEQRSQIMPITKKYPLETLIQTLEKYPLKPRNRITIEYVVLKDFNDSPEDAKRLAGISRRFPSKVNTIPFNPDPRLPLFERPSPEDMERFQAQLLKHGVYSRSRKSRGIELQGACGQLISTKMGLKKQKFSK